MSEKSPDSGQVGVEITPAMIAAGASILREAITELADGDVTPSEVSILVHCAMERCRLSGQG